MAESRYTLASTDAERARLARQAQKLEPLTRRVFSAAGIAEGMRVLDVGCGTGDVSALVAELVGSNGSVIGCDRDARQVAAAAARWASLSGVHFEAADLTDPPAGPFDAVVGRLVLMYQPEIETAVARLARVIRPGGVMAFIEMNNRFDAPTAIQWPPYSPLEERLQALIGQAFASTGVQPMTGLRLPGAMRSAGLDPHQPYETGAVIYEGREGAEMVAALVRSMFPVLESGGADLTGIDLETLANDVHDEHGDERIVALGPFLGVWATKP